jgi:SpoVK/Ycf46/Vps4 family AAA+-type ATPase
MSPDTVLLLHQVGESERILADIFQRARQSAPAVVFFDEIDAVFGSRGSESSSCQKV